MNPDQQPTTPPPAGPEPEPETNPVPPPEPQPEESTPTQQPEPIAAAPVSNAPTGGDELPSAFSLFKPSWEALKLNLGTFVILALLPLVVLPALLFSIMGIGTSDNHTALTGAGVVVMLIFVFLVLLLSPAVSFTQVKSAQGQKVSVGEALRTGFHNLLRFWGAMIIAGLLVLGGLILLIVPGLFMIKRYFLVPYAVFTENGGVRDTLKKSHELTKGRGIAVWGVIGVTFLISLVGVIPLLGWIASLVGSILYYCAPALRWNQLRNLGPTPVKA